MEEGWGGFLPLDRLIIIKSLSKKSDRDGKCKCDSVNELNKVARIAFHGRATIWMDVCV
jgi:hypothetical protein